MTTTTATRRPSIAARRAGYVIATLVNVALLVAINAWPGWQSVPILTDETTEVLGLVNLSLAAGIATNVVYAMHDAPWLKALGGMITAVIGIAVLTRMWQVYPFDFGTPPSAWNTVVRFLLAVAMIGTGIGLLVNVFALARLAVRSGPS